MMRASERESDIKDGFALQKGAASPERAAKGKKRARRPAASARVAMTGCSRDSMLVVSCVCARYGLREVLEKK